MVNSIPTSYVTFFGAAKEVTGSCHRVTHNGVNLLLDCGMQQGSRKNDYDPQEIFAFDPQSIDAVILSHAHLDHSGQLPRLIAQGFNGPIYCTKGTLGLLEILLADAFKIYSIDLEHENKRRKKANKEPLQLEYSAEDVHKVLACCKPVSYHHDFQISSTFTVNFSNAGHILGSAIVRLTLMGEVEKTIVFSGDIGNRETALMPDPEKLPNSDWVIMEGTYGDRNHKDNIATLDELRGIVKSASASEGNIIIPSFAIGRTQELIFALGKLYQEGLLRDWDVYLDSPMAQAVTRFYDANEERFDPVDQEVLRKFSSGGLIDFLPNLVMIENVEDSKSINEQKHRALIIAGSGMCTGGRIRRHFENRISSSDNHIVFVGYQANGTLGRLLVDGVKRIKLFRKQHKVKAVIHTLNGLSAHAGQDELVEWAKAASSTTQFVLVHGEQDALSALSERLHQECGYTVSIPSKGDTIYLD